MKKSACIVSALSLLASAAAASVSSPANAQTCNVLNSCSGTVVGTHSYYGLLSGEGNKIEAGTSVIAGGLDNTITVGDSAILGGVSNTASGGNSIVGGGYGNVASGDDSFVGGGLYNTASGEYSAVPGGNNNVASGDYSFAIGNWAKATHQGSFVWSDATATSSAPFADFGVNQFDVQATGGFHIYGSATGYNAIRAYGGFEIFSSTSTGVILAPNQNSFSALSDRNAKTDIADIDPDTVLDQLMLAPAQTWRYIADDGQSRHMGPMAQDFRAAFGLGPNDDKHIVQQDIEGVTYAAAQALYVKNKELVAKNEQLETKLASFEARLEALEAGRR